jgi:hypothetical protein
MPDTKVVKIIQRVSVPHSETRVRTWVGYVERQIEREIDTEGRMIRSQVISEHELCRFETKEVLETDVKVDEEKIEIEEFDDE